MNARLELIVRLIMEHNAIDYDAVYLFIRDHYLNSRFEGSPMRREYPNYPNLVVRSTIEQIGATGRGFISMYESRTGRVIIFDAALNILNTDEPPAQIQRKPGLITHLYGR